MDKDRVQIPDKLYFRIGDVAEIVDVKPYVLRYWETEFSFLSPDKSSTGQRIYRKNDVETLLLIKHLLYKERYSIEGARKRINELRREGGLNSFKRENVLGGEEVLALQEKLESIREAAEDLSSALKTPVREIFRI